MTTRSKTVLKTYFETGDKPTQTQFADLIDSLAHVSEVGGTPATFPTDTIDETHVGRLFTLDENGKAILTQKTGGNDAQAAILQISCDENLAFDIPVHPVFLLTLNENFDEDDYIQLPHPRSEFSGISFTGKTSPSAANEFTIGASIEDTRDALMEAIDDLWNVTSEQTVAITAVDTDKIQIEITATHVLSQGGSAAQMVLPSEFNGIATDFVEGGVDATYTQTQTGVDGVLGLAFVNEYPNTAYDLTKCLQLSFNANDSNKLYLVSILRPDMPNGTVAFGYKIPQSGAELLGNIAHIYAGNIGGDNNLSTAFAVSSVQTSGSDKFVTLTQNNMQVLSQPLYGFSATIDDITTTIEQNFQAGGIAFVKGQVVGFVKDVVDGQVILDRSWIVRGVLAAGSNTLPAPEMGDYGHFKKVLMPSNDGTLENVIHWGSALENPAADVAAAMFLNGGYIALETKETGAIWVKPVSHNQ